MGKGRWQHFAANRNHTEPKGQRLEPENQHELSEPCALQGARTVCAVRRVVVSLLQAGGTEEKFLGYWHIWR